jgi:N-acetyl-anhydromuramyl-L-alanine amidase AmpD
MANGWYPKAVKKKIPAGVNDPEIIPALAILHVAVTTIASLFDFFLRRSGGIESHFYVRKDGTVEQYRSVFREADANLGANSYLIAGKRFGAVSIETAGLGPGWWNKAQKAAIKELLLWLNAEHGIRLRAVRLPQPDLAHGGVSYHTRFKSWSPVAKSCPGPNRIKQYNSWLLPWMSSVRNCTHCPVHCPSEED